jgi:hypothetical protein
MIHNGSLRRRNMFTADRRTAKVIVSFMGLLFLSSCAGSSEYMKPAVSQIAPTQDKALVRFMRPSGLGAAISFNVFDGSRILGNSVAKSQFDYLTEPGHHVFMATAENKAFMEADLTPGKVYYVLLRVYPGAWRARVAFVPVTRGSEYWDTVFQYDKELQRLEPDEPKLQAWEDANREKIQEIVAAYESESKEKREWPRLMPEDGR